MQRREAMMPEGIPSLRWWATASDEALAEQIQADAILRRTLDATIQWPDASLRVLVVFIRRLARRALHLIEHEPDAMQADLQAKVLDMGVQVAEEVCRDLGLDPRSGRPVAP
jgi:hypothetical protein